MNQAKILCSVLLLAVLYLPDAARGSWHESAPRFSGQLRDVTILTAPRTAPDYRFTGPEGEPLSLAG